MSVHRLPADAVLLTGHALTAAMYAVHIAQDHRRRQGLPPSTALAALADAMSARGQEDIPQESTGEAGHMIDTQEAAELLGCSPRQARRLAPTLGGRMVGGRWLVDRQAVAEHIEGRP